MSTEPAPATHAGPDAAELIAAHLARTSFDDLPQTTVAATKASILDTLGCMLAGTASADIAAIGALVAESGGRASSTVVLGGGLQVPPAQAVLVNAAMVHQFDYDDTHDLAICHPTSASLPPALALAEARGGVSGRALIAAVALGSDLACRVALAIEGGLIDHPWFRAPVVGIFGATAAAAKILGASEAQHLEALGLALPMVSCTRASLHQSGSSVRSIRDGLVYRNGVLAAELAMRGVHGDRGVFDGPYGYYQVFFRGAYQRDRLLHGLGTRYETEHVSLKPWPSRRTLHRTITAVLDVMTAHDLAFAQIDHVDVLVGAVNRPWCQPCGTGWVPRQRIDLLNNMLFAVGAAIRHRDVMLRLYCDPALADEIVTTAVPKVRWHEVGASGAGAISEPGQVRIVTLDGAVHEGRCEVPLGHPTRPMSPAQQRAKVRPARCGRWMRRGRRRSSTW